jgi:hypothetical protein
MIVSVDATVGYNRLVRYYDDLMGGQFVQCPQILPQGHTDTGANLF